MSGLAKSRVGTRIDAARLSKLVERPGIDPRLWLCYAEVLEVGVEAASATDPRAGGVFVCVRLLPSEDEVTVHMGAAYAGDGFGFYLPLLPDDLVVVGCPSGNFDNGLAILSRLWSASDPPPQEAVDHPDDVVLRVRPDKHCRIRVTGGGNVVLRVENGKVLLGAETGTKAVARKGDAVNLGECRVTVGAANLGQCVTAVIIDGAALPVSPAPLPPPYPDRGEVNEGSSRVEASD